MSKSIVSDDAVAAFLANNDVKVIAEGERSTKSTQADDCTERSMREAENNFNDEFNTYLRATY